MKPQRPRALVNANPKYQWIKFILMFLVEKLELSVMGGNCYLACTNTSTCIYSGQLDQIEIYSVYQMCIYFLSQFSVCCWIFTFDWCTGIHVDCRDPIYSQPSQNKMTKQSTIQNGTIYSMHNINC